ncbi:MAG: cyanophycinase [Planctomycetes bacterium]|nr:cyanophycinase [Planctomycetota bacterium]
MSTPALLRSFAGSLLFATLACHAAPIARPAETGARGTLLLIGGGLDDDHGEVYRRLLELASAKGTPRIVIMTAATGPQEQEAIDKTEALRCWSSDVQVEIVRRETSTEDTVAAIDAATALFFTGGDQERITARYRRDGAETEELLAMQRLLARGGVIAGASAGDAMMGATMFTGGGSASALGIVDPETQPGPRLAQGLGFLPLALTDSHFFERDRLGRLVAGLEASGTRLGLGVGEDACLEIDLAHGTARGVSVAESLLVDAAGLERDGLSRRGLRARLIGQGEVVSLRERLASPRPMSSPRPPGPPHEVPIVEPGQNRQLASWRLFRHARTASSGVWRLALQGWAIEAWAHPDEPGEFVVEVAVASR